MKRLLLTSTAVLAIGAVVPATAQTTAKKNVHGGKCWVQTDARRLTGYYDVCTVTKRPDATPGAAAQSRPIPSPWG